MDEAQLADNIAQVRSTIAEAARQAGRRPEEVTLVAVSKTMPVALVRIAYNLGVSHFGENRVQEALPKIEAFHPEGMYWHMIGHLQSNKAGKVVAPFDYVQSVDSLHLARALDRYADQHGKRLPVLLQVNVSGEASKEGAPLAEAPELARPAAHRGTGVDDDCAAGRERRGGTPGVSQAAHAARPAAH